MKIDLNSSFEVIWIECFWNLEKSAYFALGKFDLLKIINLS